MATKTGQEKRDALRLDLNQDLTSATGLALNTPDLDKACEMALPTPVLNKKVLDMYQNKAEPVQPQTSSPPVVVIAEVQPSHQLPLPAGQSVTTAAIKPFQTGQSYPQPVIIVSSSSAIRQATQPSHPRIGQTSNANVVHATLPIAPVDPMEQERLKVDRKRERNRAAAQRCREKKIKRITDLSTEVEELEAQQSSLIEDLTRLQQTTSQILTAVKNHKSAGCDLENPAITKLILDAEAMKKAIDDQLSSIAPRTSTMSSNMDATSDESGNDD